MIIKNLSNLENKNYYVVIIGSGPAGISVALELEKKGIYSLILEAGNLNNNPNSEEFLRSVSIGDHNGDFTSNRMRMFGGTSSIWGGNCNPMNISNFKDWPIKQPDLNKYTKKANEILNLKKKFTSQSFNKNLNIYNLVWSNIRFNENYFEHIKNSKFISLSLNTCFLNMNSLGNKIKTIECLSSNKIYNIKSNYFILACGGIENSRILLWLRSKNSQLLDKDLPIGKYYMHHPYHKVSEGVINYTKLRNFYSKKNFLNIPFVTCDSNIYLEAKNDFLLKNNIPNSGMYINFKNINIENNLFKQLRCAAPNFVKKLYDQINSNEIYEISINTLQEQEPIEENRILLSNQVDPNGVPLTKIFWKKLSSEKKSARIILEEIGKFLVEKEIGRLAIENYLYEQNADYDIISGNHQMGGTRVGNNKTDSVVDKNLKVHGVENLFVAGSSVFRTSGHCHPTYTIVQLSLRLADHIISIKS